MVKKKPSPPNLDQFRKTTLNYPDGLSVTNSPSCDITNNPIPSVHTYFTIMRQ